MNFLRSSPFNPLVLASMLQSFIFCCCAVRGFSPFASFPADRHSLMNFLRSSPLSCLAAASALQPFIFSCCGVAAEVGSAKAANNSSTGNLHCIDLLPDGLDRVHYAAAACGVGKSA